MHIDSYSFGSMTVDGRMYTSDLIIFPNKIISDWWREEGHSLCMGDLKDVMGYRPDILVVGKGASGCMNVPESIREKLEAEQIELIAENTEKACEIFNEQVQEGKRVVGAFHLTC